MDGLTLAMEAKMDRVPSTAGRMIDSGSSAWRWKGDACVVQWECASQSLIMVRRAVERTHSVSHSVDALDSLIESSLLSNILNDDKLERLALEEVLDVLSLTNPSRPSESAPSSLAKLRQRGRGRARTLETDRTVPTTLKPASKKALTTWIPKKPEAPVTRICAMEKASVGRDGRRKWEGITDLGTQLGNGQGHGFDLLMVLMRI